MRIGVWLFQIHHAPTFQNAGFAEDVNEFVTQPFEPFVLTMDAATAQVRRFVDSMMFHPRATSD
jgi:hypothetical protein